MLKVLRALRRALASMRLAAALIASLALGSLLATLIPQGQEPAYYYQRYGRPAADLILASGYSDFFGSALFIAPTALFFLNLSACAIGRFLRALRSPPPRRHGPDLLHLGLLLFMVGASLTAIERRGGVAHLAVGDSVRLPDGGMITLRSFESERYEDGRPREWTSLVSVEGDEGTAIGSFPIKVNHPLTIGRLSVYQAAHGTRTALDLSGPAGQEVSLAPGDSAELSGRTLTFFGQAGAGALVSVAGPDGAREYAVRAGDAIGDILVRALRQEEVSGLMIVRDSFFGLVLASLGLIAAGLAMTFIQNLGETRK